MPCEISGEFVEACLQLRHSKFRTAANPTAVLDRALGLVFEHSAADSPWLSLSERGDVLSPLLMRLSVFSWLQVSFRLSEASKLSRLPIPEHQPYQVCATFDFFDFPAIESRLSYF